MRAASESRDMEEMIEGWTQPAIFYARTYKQAQRTLAAEARAAGQRRGGCCLADRVAHT